MSHFSVLVILPKEAQFQTQDQTKAHTEAYPIVEALIAKYDENIEAEPYEAECYCVGQQARSDARTLADEKYGSIDERRNTFHPPHDNVPFDQMDDAKFKANNDAWQAHIKARLDGEQQLFDAHPLKETANADCESCSGSGVRTTTYNPDSKWDWWEIGGRWSGEFTDDGRDVFPLTDLKNGWSTFAIVTPDGQYHAHGDMGWWGITSNERPEWSALQYEIASSFPEHIGVCTDWHI